MRTRLLILALLSSPTIAADEDSASKRTCDDATYARLRAAKVSACDRGGTMKCTQNTSCAEIQNQIIKLNACIVARRAVMDTCFRELEARCRRDEESCEE